MKRLILIPASLFCASCAFAQSKCITAPVNITGNQVTLTSSGAKSVTDNQTYVYYERKRHRKHDQMYTVANANNPSMPLMLNENKDVKAIPETYNVTVNTPQSNVAVCHDSTLNLSANINVEKVSSFTGNYPNRDNKVYKEVSKHDYKMAARKKRKIERLEAKIERKSHTDVDVRSSNS